MNDPVKDCLDRISQGLIGSTLNSNLHGEITNMAKPTLKDFREVAFNADENIHTVARTAEGTPLNHRPRTLSRAQTEGLAGSSFGGGMFICTNPVRPKGTHKKADVTAVRNLVFESDTLPPDEQITLEVSRCPVLCYRALEIKVSSLLGVP